MSRRIPNEFIEAVVKRHDIVDIVGRYVHLTKQGHYLKGLCPFHSEKTPSFTVTPEKQIFYCYGCHAGGNVIRFLMDIEGYTFAEAVRQLAMEAGMATDWEPERRPPTEEERKRETLREAYEFACKFFHHILLNTEQGKPALDYLRRRNIHDKLIEEFRIGYAPPMWNTLAQLLEKRGFDLALMEQGGLLGRATGRDGYLDKFRDRIMFPIQDAKGRVIAFAGRAMGDVQPKYMNSPETMLFNKSSTLYNFHQARPDIRKTGTVVLFEGYVDVIKAWEAGVRNGVATMGTALTREHARQLRHAAREAILCYDGDDAGQHAAFKNIPILEQEGLHVKVALLPKGMDPDEYVAKHGPERFRTDVIEPAVPQIEFKLRYIRRNFDLQHTDGRLRYIATALRLVAELDNPVDRDHYVRELAREFQYSPEALRQQMNEARQEILKKQELRDNPSQSWNNVRNNTLHIHIPPAPKPAHERAEIALLSAMMHDREAAEQVQNAIGDRFLSEVHAALAAYLYDYYDRGNEPDIGRFIAGLQDEDLERTATYISMQDPMPALAALDDYIAAVQIYPKLMELKQKQKAAGQLGDPLEAARAVKQITEDILALEKQLKSL